MGQLVYILGKSGTGKSYSMRNFPQDKIAVINVQGKILPFRGSMNIEQTAVDQSDKIVKALEAYARKYKTITVDDYQYVMSNEFMRRSAERGYDKFTEIGRHAWDIANAVRNLPADVIVYVMCHTERDDEGNEKIKTIGKLLDEKICLEGMSTIVLKTAVSDGQYSFLTQNNGRDTTKSPHGMFPSYAIENDLYYVDQKIRNYYGFAGSLTDEEMKAVDEMAKKDDVPFTGGKEERKRGRGRAKEEKPAETPAEEKKEERATDAEKPRGRRATAESVDNNAESPQSDAGDAEKEISNVGNTSATEGMFEKARTRSRRRKGEDFPTEAGQTETGSVGTLPRTREEVAKDNAERVANAGFEEAGERDEVPFEEVENPPVDKLPRRKRRTEEPAEPVEETKEEAPAAVADGGRRRRRRG